MSTQSGRLPDFLGIGAQKAGTSWMHDRLQAHPGTWLPPIKEVHFFDTLDAVDGPIHRFARELRLKHFYLVFRHQVEQGQVSLSTLRWYAHLALGEPQDEAWYGGLFAPAGGSVAGELTPEYSLLCDEQVRRVHGLMPDAKILLGFRDPIDRAWSGLRFSHAQGWLDLERLDEVGVQEWLSQSLERNRAAYDDILRRWRGSFGRERVFTWFYEELTDDPEALLRRVCDFLGLPWDPRLLRGAEARVNASPPAPLPPAWERILAQHHRGMIDELEAESGGVVTRWKERIDRAAGAS